MRAEDLPPFLQDLQHESGGREGKRQARQQVDQVDPPLHFEKVYVEGDDKPRDQDLQRPQAEHGAAQRPQSARLHFEADQEQQQYYPKLGEMPHVLHLGGNGRAGGVRPDNDTGHQQTQDRAQAKAPEDGYCDGGSHQQQHCRIHE